MSWKPDDMKNSANLTFHSDSSTGVLSLVSVLGFRESIGFDLVPLAPPAAGAAPGACNRGLN